MKYNFPAWKSLSSNFWTCKHVVAKPKWLILDHVDKIAHATSFTDYVNMSILLGEPFVPLLAYTMVRAVVNAIEIIR